MATCVVCGGRSDATALALCDECADGVATTVGLCPEQLVSPAHTGRGAALIDQWGRAHLLGDRVVVGREIETADFAVLEGGISRRHAELVRTDGRWTLRDLGSTNGTFLNGHPVSGIVTLDSGALINFSQVGMYFVCGAALPSEEGPDLRQTARPHVKTNPPRAQFVAAEVEPEEEVTGVGMITVRLRVSVPTSGAAGLVEVEGKPVQLTGIQLDFVRVLADRMIAEAGLNELVRGYISSSELLATLQWETPNPDDNHLKQLVRRVRRALSRADIGNLIDSRRGFGYRFRAIPILE